MATNEQAVRDAALALRDAIADAVAAGYRIDWPSNAAGLDKIAISETGRIGQSVPLAPGDEYDAMTKAALVELAVARGLDVPSGATKADVIVLLKNPPPPAPVTTGL